MNDTPNEFTVGQHNYRAYPLNALAQFDVLKRLAPILGSLKSVAAATAAGEDMDIAALDPLMKAISSIPDADSHFVLEACLTKVYRQGEGGRGWQKMWSIGGGLVFEDISLPEMLQICGRVLGATYGDFFPGSLSNSKGEEAA